MKIYNSIFLTLSLALASGGCQNKDYDIEAPVIAPINADAITGSLDGDNYVWTWQPSGDKKMQVSVYDGKTLAMAETVEGTSFVHPSIDTNIDYTYEYKLTDGSNLSSGVVKHYMRPGASKMTGLSMTQIEKAGGYDAKIVWDANPTATNVELKATNGAERIISQTLASDATEFNIENVTYGEEWNVTLTAVNAEGRSLPVSTGLKIGKTAIGFLSVYPTPDELISKGDDDEACAWLWLHEEYPTAQYVYFGDIASVEDARPGECGRGRRLCDARCGE